MMNSIRRGALGVSSYEIAKVDTILIWK